MSLTVAMDNALSGLATNQSAMNTTSHNIANVNTPGYHKVTPIQQSVVTAGVGTGVKLASNQRAVDAFLAKQQTTVTTALGGYNKQVDLYSSIDQLYGTPGANADNVSVAANSLTVTIANFRQSIDNFAVAPATQPPQTVVTNAQIMCTQLNTMSSQIQTLRQQCDQQIADGLTNVNVDIQSISDLNTQIAQGLVTNTDVSDLQNQRDELVRDVSQYMDIASYTNSRGELILSTKQGNVMVNGGGIYYQFGQINPASPYTLQTYVAPGVFTATTVTNQLGLGTMGKNGLPDLTSQLAAGGGILGALISQRGQFSAVATAPSPLGQLQMRTAELNVLAVQLYSQVQTASLDTTNTAAYTYPTYNDANHFFEGVDTSNPVTAAPPAGTNYNIDNAATIAVHRQIVANPNLLNTDTATSTFDSSIATNLQTQVDSSSISFSNITGTPNMGIGSVTGTFAKFASATETNVAILNKTAQVNQTYNQNLLTSVNYRVGQVVGVNLDVELSRLIQLQQAYQASAKVITTADQMLQTLLTLKQ